MGVKRGLGRKIKHRAPDGNDSSKRDCDVTAFHSSLPTPVPPLRGGGGERRARTEVLGDREPREPRRSGSGLQEARAEPGRQGAPGVTNSKSPGSDGRGRGLGCRGWGWGAGLAEKTLQGAPRGAEGLALSASGAAQTLATARVSEEPRAESGSRDPARFTFFLAAANLLCRVSSDILGRGGGNGRGGHITAIPATTAELLPAATAPLCK